MSSKNSTNEIKFLSKSSIPITISYLSESAVLLTNTFIAGQIGASTLAGLGLGASILYPLTFAGAGLTSTSSVMAAYGPESRTLKRRVLKSGIIISLLSTPILVGATFSTLYLIGFLNIKATLINSALSYLLFGVLLIPCILIFNTYRGILTIENRSSIISNASFLSVIVNILIAPTLALGLDMGVSGLAISTVISGASMVAYVILKSKNWNSGTPQKTKSLKPDNLLRNYFKIGTPIAVLGLMESGMFLALSSVAASFGTGFMAAHTLAISISDIVSAFAFGLGEAVTARLALKQGRTSAGNWNTYRYATALAVAVSIFFAVLVYFFQDTIVRIFISGNEEVLALENFSLIAFVFCLFLCFDNLQSVQYRALKGVSDVRIPFILSVSCYWLIGVALGVLLSRPFFLGAAGIWLGLFLGVMCTSVLLHFRSAYIIKKDS